MEQQIEVMRRQDNLRRDGIKSVGLVFFAGLAIVVLLGVINFYGGAESLEISSTTSGILTTPVTITLIIVLVILGFPIYYYLRINQMKGKQ